MRHTGGITVSEERLEFDRVSLVKVSGFFERAFTLKKESNSCRGLWWHYVKDFSTISLGRQTDTVDLLCQAQGLSFQQQKATLQTNR